MIKHYRPDPNEPMVDDGGEAWALLNNLLIARALFRCGALLVKLAELRRALK